MKRLFSHSTIMVLFSFFLLFSCNQNELMELDKGHANLNLTSNSNTEIILSEVDHSNNGIDLEWTTGTNFGTGNKILYTLEIDQAGNDFSSPYVVFAETKQVYSWKVSVEDLNNILVDKMGIPVGSTAQLQARVRASVPQSEKVQESILDFSVKTYKPVTESLFIIGSGAPCGWSLDGAAEMTRKDNGVFTWIGKLKQGEIKFVVSRTDFVPCYCKGPDGKLFYRESFDQPDGAFDIEKDHLYRVDINLLIGFLSIIESEGEVPAFERLFFMGDLTNWNCIEMARDPLDKFLFRMGRYFEPGVEVHFKFATRFDGDKFANMYKSTTPDAPYTDQSVEYVTGYEPDRKWMLKEDEKDKAYKICFDIRADRERMIMTPFESFEKIYLVGSASPKGWDLALATPMNKVSAYVMEWEGELVPGELKFTCDKQMDWCGAWFMPTQPGEPTGDVEQMLFIHKNNEACQSQYLDVVVNDIDFKWTISTAGTYKITLNQLEETVSIVKQ